MRQTLREKDDMAAGFDVDGHLESAEASVDDTADVSARHSRHRYLHQPPTHRLVSLDELLNAVRNSDEHNRGPHRMIGQGLDRICDCSTRLAG